MLGGAHLELHKSKTYETRLAKEEVSRQELRQRVHVADNKVMDALHEIMAAWQKQQTSTKKEKDQAWKILKDPETAGWGALTPASGCLL
ncbi:transcriptional adaptor 3 [Saguinus oedipus]|uniref:Transcriptional adaptor 3 n=1 Tax=Saguinus oedipus TaxID=9490 RepID=A0ABQ9VUN7_SAGOE|nr:transcriptional adaptor 3 [Saguinus oedipus]